MIYDEKEGLFLLPINLQMFGNVTHESNLPGSYKKGSVPYNKYVQVNTNILNEYGTFVFEGISTSSSTFIPASNCNFQSLIYYYGEEAGIYPNAYIHSLTNAQTDYINLLDIGTYYVWFDGENRGSLTITTNTFVASTEITKNFVIANKTGSNPVRASLTWENPTSSTLYHYYALSTSAAPNTGTVYGFYGPYTCNANSSGSLSGISIQYENVSGLSDGAYLNLISYKTNNASWNIKTSGFNDISRSNIYRTDTIRVRNLYFNFENPQSSSINGRWGTQVTMPSFGGYGLINWSNTNLGLAVYQSNTLRWTNDYNIGTYVNSITNNTYWINMSGLSNIRNPYNINYRSSIPSNGGNNWINGTSTYYQIDISSSQTRTIPFPDAHNIAASQYGEYEFNRYDITRPNVDNGGTLPTMLLNTLTIPASSYGNILISSVWDYKKSGNGTLTAINAGTLFDINNTSRSFNGYRFNFYASTAPSTPITSVSYTSSTNPTPKTGRFEAQSNAGYEFLSSSILNYPFGLDGSISTVPYDNLFTFHQNEFTSTILPAPLFGNSGTVKYNYSISGLIAANINVGIATRPFEHPIYVSMGANISSFIYNGQNYNSSWPDKYTYAEKTYYRLNQATFNVLGTYSYPITNIGTTAGFYAPNHTILINTDSVWSNEKILSSAFVNLPEATPIQYFINNSVGTGIVSASISPNNYNAITDTFTPTLEVTKVFGYGDVVISGTIRNNNIVLESGLTSIQTVTNPSYNDYNYAISAIKAIYNINKNITTPFGISSYTLNKTTYEISTSKQGVSISYTMNSGYAMNTSKFVSVGDFINSTGTVFYGSDQTFNSFNIPANTTGDVVVTVPEPDKIDYFITPGSISGINGVDSVTFDEDFYTISHTDTKTVEVPIGLKAGYSQPTGSLTVIGSSTSEVTNRNFKININGFGNITVTPASPIVVPYTITINPIAIPQYGVSGISAVSISPSQYNVETPSFTPSISSITYTNIGFNDYVVTPISQIPVGSTGHRSFDIYAVPVTFNINITKGASISSYRYGGSQYSADSLIDTYNVFNSSKDIAITDIVVANQLYLPVSNFTIGTVPTGSTGHKSFSLSSSLKTNTISLSSLPTGYQSSVFSESTYNTTIAASKTITLTHTMSLGYLQPSDNLVVSNVYSDSGSQVSVTGVNNRSFTIPIRSWGDVSVTLGTPAPINYLVNFQNNNSLNIPTGVNTDGFGVLPTNYMVTDTYPKTFTLNIGPKPGYLNPTWRVNGTDRNMSDLTFSMASFSTTPPNVLVFGGQTINYNLNVIKGTGITDYRVVSSGLTYATDATIATYNVLTSFNYRLANINVINTLWNPVANYNVFSIALGTTGDKQNTISTTLKASSITSTLPTGVSSVTINPSSYQSVIDGTERTVTLSYAMNVGYSAPTSFSVSGSLSVINNVSSSATITPINSTAFNIASHTVGGLVVNPAAPSKINYNLNGSLPFGMNNMSFFIAPNTVSTYQIAPLTRTVSITYGMNNGYSQPTTNLIISQGPGTIINNRAFALPVNAYGDITITPNEISKISYSISVVNKPNGIGAVTINPSTYVINHTSDIGVGIDFATNVGWRLSENNLTAVGSSTLVKSFNTFDILLNGFGNINITPANPVQNIYNITINPNPKPVAINQWSVSPNNYSVDVIGNWPKTFNITATNKSGYNMPTWNINGVNNSATSFTMSSFTETLPTLEITAGNAINYNILLNYSSLNSGITSASISPSVYNIESTNFTPSISGVTYAGGYSGYTSSAPISQVNIGSIGNISYTITGTPINYSISALRGTGINTANLSKTSYNIHQTPFNLTWSDITYNPGYSGYTLAGDSLSVSTGTYGERSYAIIGSEITYNISILNPSTSSIVSFNYGGQTWSNQESIIDTYTITSPDKDIVLTDVIYKEGEEQGSDTINFGTISTGSIGHEQYVLGSVYNVYIDIDSWTNGSVKHYKIQSFDYNGNTFSVGSRDIVWIDYFVEATPQLTIDIDNIVYQDGYTGQTSYSFGNIDPSTVTEDKIFVMDETDLISYDITITKPSTIVSYVYNNSITYTDNIAVVDTYDIITPNKIINLTNIIYATGYQGPTSLTVGTVTFGSIGDKSYTISSPTLIQYTIAINKNDPSSKINSFSSDIKYSVSQEPVANATFTILSEDIVITAKNIVYTTATNSDGTWSLYTGPETYGYDDGVTTTWLVPKGTAQNVTFTIPANSIAQPNVFSISYNNVSKTERGYTSELIPQKLTYTYGVGASISHNSESSFLVGGNDIVSERLRSNTPIHFSYLLNSNSILVTIGNTDFGDKVVNIVWTDVTFSATIKDHYVIRDVYGINSDITKTSPISGLSTDQNVFIINYLLNSEDQDKTITNNIYSKTNLSREGWTFVNAKEISGSGTMSIVGSYNDIGGFTIPAGWYDNKTLRLIYTPNTYTITLGESNTISVIFDHEIQKWSPSNVPSVTDKIFDGFEEDGIEKISYSGIYLFTNSDYSENVTFTPKWIDRNDFIYYNAEDNIVVDSSQMENITLNNTTYARLKESTLSPVTVQNLLTDDAIETNNISTYTKYMFKMLGEFIRFRKINDQSTVKGYNNLTIISSGLNTYLNNISNLEQGLVTSMSGLISQLESAWSGANTTDLSNIGIGKPYDLWTKDSSNRLASADIFRIMFKVSNVINGTFTHWVFDGMINPSNIAETKVALAKQNMFLLSTSNGLKEIMKIKDKDNYTLYDRTPYVSDNNGIVINWEDSINGNTKPVEVYGLMPINTDRVYAKEIAMKTSWKTEILGWSSGFTNVILPHNTNVRNGEPVSTTTLTNYIRMPIKDIYSGKINASMSDATWIRNNLKDYSVNSGDLIINGLDSILGMGASAKKALSSAGEYFIPTLYYKLWINNTYSSNLRTATLTPDNINHIDTRRYVFTPLNRNIGGYVVQGPVSDISNNLRFLMSTSLDIVNIYIGKMDTNNWNTINELVQLTKEGDTNWYYLSSPFTHVAVGTYYTIVIETADKLMYNNLLIYKQFAS
jgi:hypothetical protein